MISRAFVPFPEAKMAIRMDDDSSFIKNLKRPDEKGCKDVVKKWFENGCFGLRNYAYSAEEITLKSDDKAMTFIF